MTKLMPTYVQKLDEKLIYNGWHHNLYAWWKSFKQQWIKCKFTPITDPDNPKYATAPYRWVCTCPAFIGTDSLFASILSSLSILSLPAFLLRSHAVARPPFGNTKTFVPYPRIQAM